MKTRAGARVWRDPSLASRAEVVLLQTLVSWGLVQAAEFVSGEAVTYFVDSRRVYLFYFWWFSKGKPRGKLKPFES